MYCSQCGRAIGDQPQCSNCGSPSRIPVSTPGMPPAPPLATSLSFARIAKRIHTLGVLWIAFAAYLLLRWLLILPFLHSWFGASPMWMHGSDAWVFGPLHNGSWILHVIMVLVVVRVILSVAVGYALLTRQPWGRIFAIVIAVFTLMKPVLGTILAIYTLYVLLSRDAKDYERMASLPGVPLS